MLIIFRFYLAPCSPKSPFTDLLSSYSSQWIGNDTHVGCHLALLMKDRGIWVSAGTADEGQGYLGVGWHC